MASGRAELEQQLQALRTTLDGAETESARLQCRLQLQQIELELQSRALQEAQAELQAARARYAELATANEALRARIAEYECTEERLRQFAAVVDNTSESILVVDQNGRLLTVNPAFSLCTGYSAGEAVGQSLELLCAGREDKGFYRCLIKRLRRKGGWQGELWVRRKNGDAFPVWASISAVTGAQGRIASYACVFSDITAIKRTEAELSQMAYHDALTGLANRFVFATQLDNAIAHAKRHCHRVALLYLDLDHFKAVNDTLGHEYGDRMLRTVANRLRRCVRAEDTVSRLGGDEFAIILTEIHYREDAARLARKIMRNIEQPIQVRGQRLNTSTSIGIGVYPDDAADRNALLRVADAAMYAAKQGGRCRYHFATCR